jgi:hypothetical protein
MDSFSLLRDLMGTIYQALGGTVASILDHVDRALLPYRTGSHWYALRVRHVDYDRFLLAVGSRMTELQPCRVADVACPAGHPAAGEWTSEHFFSNFKLLTKLEFPFSTAQVQALAKP